MKKVYQDRGSQMCGQACIASIAEISLREACKIVGHEHSTHTRELVKALRSLGYFCQGRLKRVTPWRPITPQAILKMSFKNRKTGHWLLMWNGGVFDPDPFGDSLDGGRITSFLEISDEAYHGT